MHRRQTHFAQITDLIHSEQFRRCVRRYRGEHKVKIFSCWAQFFYMAFRDISDNTMKTQIWITVCVYVLVVILKKQCDRSGASTAFSATFERQRVSKRAYVSICLKKHIANQNIVHIYRHYYSFQIHINMLYNIPIIILELLRVGRMH
ncbi:MAG: DUF4372 domain-containing protein [Limisphaerales bacterium]